MARYRMMIPAELFFDVEASSPEEAKAAARELAYRLRDGVDLPEADTETEFKGTVYPDEEKEPELMRTIEDDEDEDD